MIQFFPSLLNQKKSGLLLDQFPNAAAAYSLRLLNSQYTGSCIQVRRSSDNSTQNIGFVDGVLDTASLLSFVGTGDGFVRTWYDQSGNGRDVTQTTNGNQPQIVSSGIVLLENGNACLIFSGNQFLSNNNLSNTFSGNNALLSSFAVGKQNSPQVLARVFYGFGNTASNNPIRYYGITATLELRNQPFYQDRDLANINTAFISSGSFLNQCLGCVISNTNNNRVIFVNSINTQTNTVNLGSIDLNTFALGALIRTSISLHWIGSQQEAIFYPSDQSTNRTAIESNINAYYNIF